MATYSGSEESGTGEEKKPNTYPTGELNTLSKDDEVYSVTLQMLSEEASPDQYQAAVQILVKLFRNIKEHPSEEKYRQIRTENKTIAERVWQFAGAQEFLLAAGWVQVEDKLILPAETDIQQPLAILENIHSASVPAQPAPAESKESEKQRLIAEERKRQLNKLKREKEERKRIAQQIKADREETKTREAKDSHARNLNHGGKMTKFQDIGIDLNSGGG